MSRTAAVREGTRACLSVDFQFSVCRELNLIKLKPAHPVITYHMTWHGNGLDRLADDHVCGAVPLQRSGASILVPKYTVHFSRAHVQSVMRRHQHLPRRSYPPSTSGWLAVSKKH